MRIFCLLLWVAPSLAAAQDPVSEEGEVFPNSEHRLDEHVETTHKLVAPSDAETTRSYQNESVARKDFDEKKWKEVVGNVDFTEVQKPEKKKEKKQKTDSEDAGFSLPWNGPVLKLISYAVVIAAVILLVWLIVRNISFDLHIKRSRIEDDPEKPVEDIQELDIQMLLERAIQDGNFKLAVRLYYLRLLKKLNELGVISWKKDKTNRDYLSELFSRDFHYVDIRKLTTFYESVWYGEHSLEPGRFQYLQGQFESVHSRINNGAAS